MDKIRYAVIGSGWRAEFYIRIAKAVPEQFELTSVLVRDKDKGEAFSKKHDVKVVNTLEDVMSEDPAFVVLAIKRGVVSDYLIDLFKKAKAEGINTCIDTALQPFTREEPFFKKFNELMEYTDLLLVDIKHIDREEHIKLTGLPNENIQAGMRYLSEIGKPIWIRHVLVPGITDNDEYLHKTRKFIEELSNVEKIEVLPYHSMGQHKFEALGIPYQLEGVESPTAERVANATAILRGEK